MSVVTNVLLSFSIMEDDGHSDWVERPHRVVCELNKWLQANHHGSFACITEACGGEKAMEIPVYGAAFNCLNVTELIAQIRSLQFEEPENVQLFICGQEESSFSTVAPFELSSNSKK